MTGHSLDSVKSSMRRLRLTASRSLSKAETIKDKETDYILELDVQKSQSDPLVAVASSDYTVTLFSYSNRLATLAVLEEHDDVVGGVRFCQSDPNLVITCSKDKTLRCWDCRCLQKSAQIFTAPENRTAPLLSCDVSCDGRLLCAGSEAGVNNHTDDAYLFFWDRRCTTFEGCYTECHQDDITQVCFHPTDRERLATGAMDGLVCTYDLHETDEEEALQQTLQAESSVYRLHWAGSENQMLASLAHDNTFHLWQAAEGDLVSEVNALQSSLGESNPVEFLIDCLCVDEQQTSTLLAGTHTGDTHILSLDTDSRLTECSKLSGGHRSAVRCAQWQQQTGSLLTGGEDTLVCLWSAASSLSSAAKTAALAGNKMKRKAKASQSVRSRPY